MPDTFISIAARSVWREIKAGGCGNQGRVTQSPAPLRVSLNRNYLILFAVDAIELTVELLTIRHHRKPSFDLARLWPI